jgi:hypothetical protein
MTGFRLLLTCISLTACASRPAAPPKMVSDSASTEPTAPTESTVVVKRAPRLKTANPAPGEPTPPGCGGVGAQKTAKE